MRTNEKRKADVGHVLNDDLALENLPEDSTFSMEVDRPPAVNFSYNLLKDGGLPGQVDGNHRMTWYCEATTSLGYRSGTERGDSIKTRHNNPYRQIKSVCSKFGSALVREGDG